MDGGPEKDRQGTEPSGDRSSGASGQVDPPASGPSLGALFGESPPVDGPTTDESHGDSLYRSPQELLQRRRRLIAALLFALTAISTTYVGGATYALWILVVLGTHELGHSWQARLYGLRASPPFFIPFPLQPLGTLGAVITLRTRLPHRRALFDVAVAGPLAGLVPALILSCVGVANSSWVPVAELTWGRDEPLLFQWLGRWLLGAPPDGMALALHPLAMAGWVGVYITALNLMPIGQLDGGHILYSLLHRRTRWISPLLLAAASLWIVAFGYWQWTLLVVLLLFFGLRHPPTLDDAQELGTTRTVVGWLVLLFFVVGWTPRPFIP